MNRPTLDELRRDLGRAAVGLSDEELSRLQAQIEWFARFAVDQASAARAERLRPDLQRSA